MAGMPILLYNNIIMDLGTKNANDLISKNEQVSKAAAEAIVNSKDIKSFKCLCEKSEFIFDFIKEKITNKLISAVNGNNIGNIFEFTKVYNSDFENFIVLSFVNFADEDLTDKILETFEEGTDEQKAYAALYFYYINDPLALEYLEKYAFSDFELLSQNCAKTLKKFNDKKLYNKSIEIIKNNEVDDFEKIKYINFLTAYNDKAALGILFDYLKYTGLKGFIAESILYISGLIELADNGTNFYDALNIFDIILDSYPEEISLETVVDFEILNFIKYLSDYLKNNDDTYTKRVLLKAKYKFNLFSKEDIYTFDLAKHAKKEVFNISNFINNIGIDLFHHFEEELYSDKRERVLEALNVILNFGRSDFSSDVSKLASTTAYEDVISESIRVLKTFGQLNLVNKDEILHKIKNENLRIMTESYFK